MHCYLLNARSIANKLSELHHLLYVENCDMVFITESFLHESVGNGFLDPKAAYSILRKDRQDGKGGGVCAIVKGDICVTPVFLHDCFSKLEIICFTVDNFLPLMRYFVVYRPPYYDQNATLYLYDLIECINHYSTGSYVNIIVGDLNLPKIDWKNLTCAENKIHKPFLEFCTSAGYTQCVDFATNGINVLDVILCNYEQIICRVTCMPPMGCSDHAVVKYTTAVTIKDSAAAKNCGNILKYDWYKADYPSMEYMLSAVDWLSLLSSYPDAMDFYSAFLSIVRHAINVCVPIRHKRCFTGKKKWPHALKVCKTNKLKLWRKLSQHPLDPNLQIKYRECCSLWNRLVHNHETEIEKHIIESRNLGAFYRYINNRLTHKDSIGAIVTSNNVVLTDDTDKANEFNKYFASVGVVDDGNLPNCLNIVDDSICLTSVNIAESDVLFAINRMKNNLSSPDDLPPVLFKKLKQVLVFPLTLLFNQLLSVAAVPRDWKNAVIIPVLKKGFAGSVTNYRPISLTSVISKLMERVISRKIAEYLISSNLLSDAQHGFLKVRSPCTNLLECMNDWTLNIDLGCNTVIVYIDFAKAFDTVSHDKLMCIFMVSVASYYCGYSAFSLTVHTKPRLAILCQN